jgi:hypothetical protein
MPCRQLLAARAPRTRQPKLAAPAPERNARRNAGAAGSKAVAEELVPLDPHMREACGAEAEHARRRRRDVNDSAANERSPIDDLQDSGAAIVEIDHLHSRSNRKGFAAATFVNPTMAAHTNMTFRIHYTSLL